MPKTRGGKEISEAEAKKLKQTGKMVSAKTGKVTGTSRTVKGASRAGERATAPAGRSSLPRIPKPPRTLERIMRARSGAQITAEEAARLRAMTRPRGLTPLLDAAGNITGFARPGAGRPIRQSTRNLTSEQKRARTQRQIQTRQRGRRMGR